MHVFNHHVLRYAEKMLGTVVCVTVALVLAALWLFVSDRHALQAENRLRATLHAVEQRSVDLQNRVEQLSVDVAAQRQAVMTADKTLREQRQLKNTWEWFGGNRAQQDAARRRLETIASQHAQAASRLRSSEAQLRTTQWQRDTAEIDRDRLAVQLRADDELKITGAYQLERTWLYLRSWALFAVAVYVIALGVIPAALKRRRHVSPSVAHAFRASARSR